MTSIRGRYQAADQQDDPSIAEVLALMSRNKWFMIPFSMLVIFLTIFYHYYRPAYVAESTILSKRVENSPFQQIMATMVGIKMMSSNHNSNDGYLEYQVIYLQSEDFYRSIAKVVINDKDFQRAARSEGLRNLTEDAVLFFLRARTRVRLTKDETLAFAVTTSHMSTAVYLTNLVARLAVDVMRENDLKEISEAKAYVQGQMDAIHAELTRFGTEMLEFRENDNHVVALGIGEGDKAFVQRFQAVEGELSQYRSKLKNNRKLIEILARQLSLQEKRLLGNGTNELPAQEIAGNLRGEIEGLRTSKSQMLLQGYQETSEEVRKLDQRLSAALARLKQLKESYPIEEGSSLMYGSADETSDQIARLKRSDIELETKIATLESSRAELFQSRSKGLKYDQQLMQVNRKIDLNFNRMENLDRKLFELRIQEISIAGKFRILETAKNANTVRLMGLPTKIVTALLASMILGWFLAFGLETLRPKIKGRHDLEKLGFVVLGGVPVARRGRYKEGPGGLKIVCQGGWDSPEAMAFKHIRTRIMNLKLPGLQGNPRVVAILSTDTAEGKSFISTNLAFCMSQLGRPTLLIDADVRRQACSAFFERKSSGGLTTLLRGEATLSETIVQTKFENLFVLPAGQYTSNVTELLSSDRLAEVMRDLRTMFSYIIIDTAPILVADGIMMARQSDTSIVVTRNQHTSKRALWDAMAELDQIDQKFKFSILNGRSESKGYYMYHPDLENKKGNTPIVTEDVPAPPVAIQSPTDAKLRLIKPPAAPPQKKKTA